MLIEDGSYLACPRCSSVFDAGELFTLQVESPNICPECRHEVADDEWEQD